MRYCLVRGHRFREQLNCMFHYKTHAGSLRGVTGSDCCCFHGNAIFELFDNKNNHNIAMPLLMVVLRTGDSWSVVAPLDGTEEGF